MAKVKYTLTIVADLDQLDPRTVSASIEQAPATIARLLATKGATYSSEAKILSEKEETQPS